MMKRAFVISLRLFRKEILKDLSCVGHFHPLNTYGEKIQPSTFKNTFFKESILLKF